MADEMNTDLRRARCHPPGPRCPWRNRPRRVGAACALVMAMLAARAEAQTCATSADCLVRSAECIGGSCTLAQPQVVIPSLGLQTVDLIEPASRAVLADGRPDVRFVFPTGAFRVAVAITSSPPVYDLAGNLQNPIDIVWYWSSDFENLATGVIPYAKGRLLDSKNGMCVNRTPNALKPGIYYWGVLAWDETGHLSHQSVLRALSVGPESLTGRFCNSVDDCGPSGATACVHPNFYCVLRCASDRDCFVGSVCDLSTVGSASGLESGVCRPPGSACPCRNDATCDDTGLSALHLCYRPTTANQSESGCDLCNPPSPSPGPNACYAAVMGAVLFHRRRGRRRR